MVDEMNIEITMPTESAKNNKFVPGYWAFQRINCWPTGRIEKIYRDREETMKIEVSYEYNGIIETSCIEDKFLDVRASTGLV